MPQLRGGTKRVKLLKKPLRLPTTALVDPALFTGRKTPGLSGGRPQPTVPEDTIFWGRPSDIRCLHVYLASSNINSSRAG